MSQYFHATIFSPKITSLLKAINMGFLKTRTGLVEVLISKRINKLINKTMGNLNMIRQVLQPTRKNIIDKNLEDKWKTNVFFCTAVDPSTTKEGKIYSDLCGCSPITYKKRKKYIYVFYVYYCITILTTATNNRSYKETIHAFTELKTNLKIMDSTQGSNSCTSKHQQR